MRNALDAAFEATRAEGRRALLPYLTVGDPESDGFVDLAVTILESGGDALELGLPFSDPLLDGPVIQRSQQRALERGVTPADVLQYAREIHKRSPKPLLVMGAYNPILAYGLERFCREAADAGVCGLIVTDVPLEEGADLREMAGSARLHTIQFATPTSTPERLRRVAEAASGFIYCISVAGVTGAHAGVAETARPLVEAVRRLTDVPAVVGFGVSSPDVARAVGEFADGVAVGTALVGLLERTPAAHREDAARAFIASLRDALDHIPSPSH